MKIYSGIDGGGTQTRLVLVDETGQRVGFAQGGSCSFTDRGLNNAREGLARLWRKAWHDAGSEPRPADALFMGMGSILSPDDARINCTLALEIGMTQPGQVTADNDAWNAHAGGLTGRPGILLISGTGSACVGKNKRGETWRAGGWGHLLHEGGSAHAFGQAALIAATREMDGRSQPTALTEFVRVALGLRDLNEIYRKVHHDGVPRADLAALAPKIVALASAGDTVARQILSKGAKDLVEMVATVADRLSLASSELALTGGLITHAREYRRLFLDQLAMILPAIRLAESGLEPVFGAVLLAYKHSHGRTPSLSFIQNLRNTCNALSPLS